MSELQDGDFLRELNSLWGIAARPKDMTSVPGKRYLSPMPSCADTESARPEPVRPRESSRQIQLRALEEHGRDVGVELSCEPMAGVGCVHHRPGHIAVTNFL